MHNHNFWVHEIIPAHKHAQLKSIYYQINNIYYQSFVITSLTDYQKINSTNTLLRQVPRSYFELSILAHNEEQCTN